jgi:hypothetical protein
MTRQPETGGPGTAPASGRRADPGGPWSIWADGESEAIRDAATREEAEQFMLGLPDHDYVYIHSPAGECYAWNPFRKYWEEI